MLFIKQFLKFNLHIIVHFFRNPCNIFGVDESIHSKNGGKLHHVRSGFLHPPKNTTIILYHVILTLLNANFDLDISVANDVANKVAKSKLPGKFMQGSPYQEVST